METPKEQKQAQYQFLGDLQESRLYRTTDGFKPYTKDDMAELLMVTTMLVYVFAQDKKYRPFAIQYANANVNLKFSSPHSLKQIIFYYLFDYLFKCCDC